VTDRGVSHRKKVFIRKRQALSSEGKADETRRVAGGQNMAILGRKKIEGVASRAVG